MPNQMHVPALIDRGVEAVEHSSRLDPVMDAMGRVSPAVSEGRAGQILRGEWLGHALHPVLTDVTIGAWVSAGVLDLVGGRRARPAAQRLVAFGVLTAPLTAATGLAEWSTTSDRQAARAGAAHAAGNAAVSVLYLMSWRARRRGQHARGVVLALAGASLTSATAYLGGHLSLAMGVGTGRRGERAPVERESHGPARAEPPDQLVDEHEAAALLSVPPDRVGVMVEEGLLQPVSTGDGRQRFERDEVLALRLQGG